ncbi:MAG: MmgE/PrpD family protein, partial [Pseudomonadota bacterium]
SDNWQRVTEFALRRSSDDMPAESLRAAALSLLDTLGMTVASAPLDSGKIARETAHLLYGGNSTDTSARMLFDGRPVSMAGAAFAAASQTDNLDGHDGYNPTKGHIGVALVPALAAVAETVNELGGPDALAALVIGYEIAGRAGISLHATVSDYHTSGAWNAIGVTALAARLRGLDDDALRQAMGIAEYHGPRSQMMREIANPTMLHDGSGWGAMVGLSAVVMAEQGFTGAPAVTVEGADVETHWTNLGTFWQMERQYIKPYPICRWAHGAIDAVRQIRAVHDIASDAIEHVQVNSFHEAACLFPSMPESTSQAQYSLAFAAATMLVHGRIGVEHIAGDGLKDPEVAAMLDRISVQELEKHSARFPEGRWADVQIALKDGRVLDSGDVNARGGPENPLGESQVIGKFLEFATPGLGRDRADRVVDAVLGLERPNSSFSNLSALLYDPV